MQDLHLEAVRLQSAEQVLARVVAAEEGRPPRLVPGAVNLDHRRVAHLTRVKVKAELTSRGVGSARVGQARTLTCSL